MNIVISFLGREMDKGHKPDKWRPSVTLAELDDLHFDQYYIIYQPGDEELLATIKTAIEKCSLGTEVIPERIQFDNPWDIAEVYEKLDDFSSKHNFAARQDDDFYIHITTGTHSAQICLFLLTESHHLPGKLIQTISPEKKIGLYQIINLDLPIYDRLAKRFAKEQTNDVAFLKSGIATRNKQFNALIDRIEKVAFRSDEPILLTGPTGAGKTQLAKRIYELKKEKNLIKGEWCSVNCATLRGDLMKSELFGYKKGAFTGATKDRQGLLKKAEKGIVFLDEIGELGLEEQAMLLKAIDEKVFRPVGGEEEENCSFQLICGTNRDLESAVTNGTFRIDLLERINLWSFSLPGLADRREDIEPNLEYELIQFEKKSGKHITFNAEAKECFLKYALDPATEWRGNFRELHAMIVRMATLCPGGRINLNVVREELARSQKPPQPERTKTDLVALLGSDYAKRFDYFELVQLQEVVKVCRTSRSLADAGKKLFAVSRKAKKSSNDSDRLGKYLAHFGLDFHTVSRNG